LFQETLIDRRHFLRTAATFSALTAAEFSPWQAMSAFYKGFPVFRKRSEVLSFHS
jgi:hypothetical protein